MKRYIYFTVFISGMTTLAAELSASRLIGNVFGTSNLVWASIIGLILIYLTLGYFLGGRWADRWPEASRMYQVLAWGAFTLGVVPYIANPVLRLAAKAFEGLDVAVLIGSFAAVLVLFSVPVTLLGTISPFAIRLSVDDPRTSGVTSGTIYAHLDAGFLHRDLHPGAGDHPNHRDAQHLSGVQPAAAMRRAGRPGKIRKPEAVTPTPMDAGRAGGPGTAHGRPIAKEQHRADL